MKIKKCPFCGAEAKLIKSEEKIDDWRIVCPRCGIETGWWMDKNAVIDVWNKRTK